MVLKEWSQAWKLYKDAGQQMRKVTGFPRQVWVYWYVWAAHMSFMLSIILVIVSLWLREPAVRDFFPAKIVSFLLESPLDPRSTGGWLMLYLGASVLFGVMARLLTFVKEKALAKQFAGEYETHGLAQYPSMVRFRYVRYALFVRALRDHGYAHSDVVRLNSFADIATLPEAPVFRLSQQPMFMFFLGVPPSSRNV